MTKKLYDVHVFYRAKEGFTVEAESPEDAIRIVNEGDPRDPAAPGERNFDEYLGVEAYRVFDGDEMVIDCEADEVPA